MVKESGVTRPFYICSPLKSKRKIKKRQLTNGLATVQPHIMQDALIDFGYNTGASKVKNFTAGKGESFFLGYMKGGAGIQKRRIGEALLFSEGKSLHFDKVGDKKSNTDLNQLINDNTKTETPAATPSPTNTCDVECPN